MYDTPFDRSFFSALKRYMTCNAIYWQKARIKSKTSLAQTASQAAVYAKGLKPENLTSYMYGLRFGNAESRLFQFAEQCFNIESLQKVFLCHSCV
jgi:hypothetical protein